MGRGSWGRRACYVACDFGEGEFSIGTENLVTISLRAHGKVTVPGAARWEPAEVLFSNTERELLDECMTIPEAWGGPDMEPALSRGRQVF